MKQNLLTISNLKPKTKVDKLLKQLIETSKSYESFTVTYNKAQDGLPKPKITRNDLESWN